MAADDPLGPPAGQRRGMRDAGFASRKVIRASISLRSIIVNFWTFEDGWPVRLAEYHDIGRIQAFSTNLATLTPP